MALFAVALGEVGGSPRMEGNEAYVARLRRWRRSRSGDG
jgi:hypothetical protein